MTHPSLDGRPLTLGLLGGGQLGYMLIESANRLGINVVVLDPNPLCPCSKIAKKFIQGDFKSPDAVEKLVTEGGCTLLTVEIEHVSCEGLERCKNKYGVQVWPSSETIRIIQNKYKQKQFLSSLNFPVVPYRELNCREDLVKAIEIFGFPVFLKTRSLAYDGRGNYLIENAEEIDKALSVLCPGSSNLRNIDYEKIYVEKHISYIMEVSVLVGRQLSSVCGSNLVAENCVVFPVIETVHARSVLRIAKCPVEGLSEVQKEKAINLAKAVVSSLPSSYGELNENCGIFCVEMFLQSKDNSVEEAYEFCVNEIAPRPHNSGHLTIEACLHSQYDVHLRCIFGLSMKSSFDVSLKHASAVMLNLFGLGDENCHKIKQIVEFFCTVPSAQIHWYFKTQQFLNRKIGHVTLLDDSFTNIMLQMKSQENYLQMKPILDSAVGICVEEHLSKSAIYEFLLSRDSSLKNLFKLDSLHAVPVAIVMGSDSDLPVMKSAAETLELFKIKFLLTIVSAHRTPSRLYKFASNAHRFGIKVIIAGAGGAAHLPGMIAALSPLPVIGVPIDTGGSLRGMDSLLSIVQMPRGIPVATVAINNSTNAALLALKILLASNESQSSIQKILNYQTSLEDAVMQKVNTLQLETWKNYC